MRFQRHCEIIKGEINLTPLVDVVFQLIIFFM
ncbi:MAG: biopolymer transporter ExbD [bacterium]|nr:biopolymer transporter ExbD [bacterium]